MLKDNHLSLLGEGDALTEALRAGIAELGHTVHVEVEVDRHEQIEPVVAAGIGAHHARQLHSESSEGG